MDGLRDGGRSAEGWLCGRRGYRLVGKSGFRISTIKLAEIVGWTGCVKRWRDSCRLIWSAAESTESALHINHATLPENYVTGMI